MEKIAIKLTIRNEDDYLDEWFQYYISLGFINYIVYNDESTDGTAHILNFYKKIVNITEHIINSSKSEHFKHIFSYKQFDYILNIDIDEFLYVSPNIQLTNYLKKHKNNNNSVIILPVVECKNKEQYYKNIKNLEVLKYNFLDNYVVNSVGARYYKHFFDPSNSTHLNGHDSNPINGTNRYKNSYIKNDNKSLIENYITKFDLIIFHFMTRNAEHFEKCLTKYRKNVDNKTYDIVNKYRICKNSLLINLNELMFESNIHINYSKNILFNFYKKYGFLIVKNLFDKQIIENILNQAQNIYKTQMFNLKIIDTLEINNQIFEEQIKILFENHFNIFLNCGKQCQHIIDLWKLSIDNKILDIVKFLGVKTPIVSTRPVLFSKNDINHTIPAHQDWASMQGSINSIVCWTPLIDINQNLGAIALVPKSHREGLLSYEKQNSFGLVDKFKDDDFLSFDVKQGDALFFSSFLVHKSGNNITKNIRWSCHFRYNDLDERTFQENGYPHAYIYKPVDELLIKDFDTLEETKNYFEKT